MLKSCRGLLGLALLLAHPMFDRCDLRGARSRGPTRSGPSAWR